jgi:hypothetical protein
MVRYPASLYVLDVRSASIVFVGLAVAGCAHLQPPRTTGWYACDTAVPEATAHCSYYRGHFLQLVDDASRERRTFVDGMKLSIRRPGGYWSPYCAYEMFDTLQEAAACAATHFAVATP